MSKVISFRLDETNSRELQALQVLNSWLEQGYSLRFVLTQALLGLDRPGAGSVRIDRSLDLVLEQIGKVIEIFRKIQPEQQTSQNADAEPSSLSDSFLASIKQKAKQGIRGAE